MIRWSWLFLSMFLVACGQMDAKLHYTPLASTRWEAPVPLKLTKNPPVSRKISNKSDKAKNNRIKPKQTRDIRAELIAQAEELLKAGSESPGFGAEDLEAAFKSAGVQTSWRADKGLESLVSTAKKKGAYKTDGEPKPGDVVLFHNQVDANGNGEADDWLTGCGIVVEEDLPRFDVVARTGHAPRKITVWPDGPVRNKVDGEKANSYLRVPSRSDPPDTIYLAGRLYAGYIDIEKLVE